MVGDAGKLDLTYGITSVSECACMLRSTTFNDSGIVSDSDRSPGGRYTITKQTPSRQIPGSLSGSPPVC